MWRQITNHYLLNNQAHFKSIPAQFEWSCFRVEQTHWVWWVEGRYNEVWFRRVFLKMSNSSSRYEPQRGRFFISLHRVVWFFFPSKFTQVFIWKKISPPSFFLLLYWFCLAVCVCFFFLENKSNYSFRDLWFKSFTFTGVVSFWFIDVLFDGFVTVSFDCFIFHCSLMTPSIILT